MRPIWTALACSFVLQLFAAPPAYAWWEYIEALSGPELHGPHVDWPIVCFNDPSFVTIGAKLPCLANVGTGARRYSIDAGIRYHWDNSFEPANGNRVKFVSLGSVLTWYPIRDSKRDVIDLSAGGGWYRFFSGAFPSFNGGYADVRADVHVPSVMRQRKLSALIPALRLGMLVFPDGFEANAFADTRNGFTSKPMDGPEKATYWGFFFDLAPLFGD